MFFKAFKRRQQHFNISQLTDSHVWQGGLLQVQINKKRNVPRAYQGKYV